MKNLYRLVVLFCFAVLLPISSFAANDLTLISEFEGGKLYKAGVLNVVVMKGDFHAMGRQYGALLKDEMSEFYDMAAVKTIMGQKKYSYKELLDMCKEGYDRNPMYVKEWVRGMSETSGLGLEKQIIVSEVLGALIMAPDKNACSGLIAWKDYSSGGKTVAGRNWDLGTLALEPYQKFLTVNVFNPTGYGHGVADINYVGSIMWQSAMNSAGLFYDLQNGSMSDPYAAKNRLNSNAALMSMMLDSGTIEQADAFFSAVRAEGGLIINVADADKAYAYEWGTSDYRRRVDDENGFLADSNDYIDPTWQVVRELPDGAASGFTKERRINLAAMAKKNKGRINANKMMEIFDKTIPEGGPSFDKASGLKTYYSIVAVPSELKLWLNVRDLQGWTEIDLKPLFVN